MKVFAGLVVATLAAPAPAIIGGKNAVDGQFPHQVRDSTRCSVTLILIGFPETLNRLPLLRWFHHQQQQGYVRRSLQAVVRQLHCWRRFRRFEQPTPDPARQLPGCPPPVQLAID